MKVHNEQLKPMKMRICIGKIRYGLGEEGSNARRPS